MIGIAYQSSKRYTPLRKQNVTMDNNGKANIARPGNMLRGSKSTLAFPGKLNRYPTGLHYIMIWHGIFSSVCSTSCKHISLSPFVTPRHDRSCDKYSILFNDVRLSSKWLSKLNRYPARVVVQSDTLMSVPVLWFEQGFYAFHFSDKVVRVAHRANAESIVLTSIPLQLIAFTKPSPQMRTSITTLNVVARRQIARIAHHTF